MMNPSVEQLGKSESDLYRTGGISTELPSKILATHFFFRVYHADVTSRWNKLYRMGRGWTVLSF